MVNITPMRERVQFLTVTMDPIEDTPQVLKAYGPAHGLDPENWIFPTSRACQADDVTRTLAEAYNLRFEQVEDGQQMNGVVTNIIDRSGRLATKPRPAL
jgi:protein SCO1/2